MNALVRLGALVALAAATAASAQSYPSLVASETIQRIAGIEVTGVPYKSSPQALTDLIGGQVQMYVVDLGSAAPR